MRFIYCPVKGEVVPYGEQAEAQPDGTVSAFRYISDDYYDGVRAPDGTDISSRTKHRRYMRENGLCTFDDYKETFERRAKERDDFFTTGGSSKAQVEDRKRDIYNAMRIYETHGRKRR